MPDSSSHSIHIGGSVEDSVLVTGSGNIIVRAEQVLLAAAQAAQQAGRDPACMLRILALLAAPVYDPRHPDSFPPPLDLKQEWHELAQTVRESRAPILLTRIVPPTLDALRRALSPRAEAQALFPHVLHFSGHAWEKEKEKKKGLLLEDELGRVHYATTDEILDALRSLPGPVDLIVLNGCNSLSVAQALVDSGLARAAVGHPRPVYDPEAVRFAARLYAELADGFPLREAVERARRAAEVTVTSGGDRHLEIVLLGDADLRFEHFTGGEPWIDDRRPPGNLPSRPGLFFGRGPHLVEIAEALAHPPKVVVLSGPAAIGKTSLALEAAHRNSWRFPGGVAFAEGPRPEEGRPGTADDLFNRLAEALKLNPEPDRVAEALALQTDRQPVLLVLDNIETLPPPERERMRRFLEHLGQESAAIVLARPPQKPLEDLPCARSISLHEGIGTDAATFYALRLAETKKKGIALTEKQAREIVHAADGHPRLVELLVAQAGRRDLAALLREVRERRGDFGKQLEALYDWSAWRLEEQGQLGAWRALLLFPGGVAPEPLLRAAAGEEGPDALRDAALADFDPALQAWRWHGTVGEYARLRWPLSDDERRARLGALLPEWTAWLGDLPPKTPETASRLEVQQANLESVLEEAAHLPPEPLLALLRALHRALPAPDRTLALRTFEERIYRTWAERETEDTERAEALHMLGWALSALGRRGEALTTAQEAVGLYRELVRSNPQAFLPDLAASLTNLGIRLSDLGHWKEALAATQEAVQICRKLAEANPQAFLPYLAISLNNLGAMLSALGRREEALMATQEAVGLFRQLAEANPPAFLPDLAGSLANLGKVLSALDQWEEALAATQEAVGLYRELAGANPQAFLPNLAIGLNNLGLMLLVLNHWEEALTAVREAASIYRQLAEANPQAFLPDLAMSLNNLGRNLSNLGRLEEALATVQEAVGYYRGLVHAIPRAFLSDLAYSLYVYGSICMSSGQAQDACDAFAEGLYAILPSVRILPAAFGELAYELLKCYLYTCKKIGKEPEAGLAEEILRHIWLPVIASHTVVGVAPLLLLVVLVMRGMVNQESEHQVVQLVKGTLVEMRERGERPALAEALERLIKGERDSAALRQSLALDCVDEEALSLVERAIADDEALILLVALAGVATGAD